MELVPEVETDPDKQSGNAGSHGPQHRTCGSSLPVEPEYHGRKEAHCIKTPREDGDLDDISGRIQCQQGGDHRKCDD